MKYISKEEAKKVYKLRKEKGEDVSIYRNKKTKRVFVGTFKEWMDFIYKEKKKLWLK